MNSEMLSYIKKDSPIHKLTGATKLIAFLLWTIVAMITYDTRLLVAMLVIGIVSFKISKSISISPHNNFTKNILYYQ